MAGFGHFDQFRPTSRSVDCRFRPRTFVRVQGNRQDAPIRVIPEAASRRRRPSDGRTQYLERHGVAATAGALAMLPHLVDDLPQCRLFGLIGEEIGRKSALGADRFADAVGAHRPLVDAPRRPVIIGARRGRRAKSWSAPARSTRRNCWSCPASASPNACAILASKCATSCPASARICATTTCRAPAGWSARKASPSTTRGHGLALAREALRYALFRQGMLAMTGAPLRAFVRSREGLEAPDLMLGWIPMLTEPTPRGPRISRRSGVTLYAHAMRPESRGQVHITSAERADRRRSSSIFCRRRLTRS